MKVSYLIVLVLLAIVTGIFISTLSAPSEYANFSEASMYPGKDFTVIGNLNKSRAVEYNPRVNANQSRFYMIDKSGHEFEVVLSQSKPQDMEKSEDIVIKGTVKDNVFLAHTILLKCPSKYEEQSKFTSSVKD